MLNIFLRPFYKLQQRFKKTKGRLKFIEIYADINEIPLKNWELLCDTNDLRHLLVHQEHWLFEVNTHALLNAYDKISDQYMQQLGIDLQNDELFILIYKKIEATQKYLEGEKHQINFVRIFDAQIKDIRKSAVKADFVGNRIAVEKWYGQKIEDTRTLLEFCKMIKMMEQEIAIKRQQAKGLNKTAVDE